MQGLKSVYETLPLVWVNNQDTPADVPLEEGVEATKQFKIAVQLVFVRAVDKGVSNRIFCKPVPGSILTSFFFFQMSQSTTNQMKTRLW